MALVNPNIAMSYRPTVEYQPRNALAEAAQIQQIVGGQRQAEMADIQLEDLRRERGILGQIAAAISAKGGPDLRTASLLMMQNPRTSEQGYNIYQALQKQQRLDEYERQFGGGAGAPTTPTSAAGAITGAAPAAAEPVKSTDFDMRSHVEEKGTPESPFIEVMPYASSPTSTQLRAQGKSQAELRGMLQSESESGRPLVRYVNPMDSVSGRVFSYSMPTSTNPFLAEPLPPFEPTNALAPSEPAPANAMLAAQPATPPAGINQLAAAGAVPNVDALRRQYNLAVKAGSPDAAVLLKQIEAALKPDPSELRTMQQLGYPLTQEGYASFRAAQMREQAPPALVPILQNGRPVLVPREQAVGQTPFSPAAVQVLGMGPQREAAGQKAPAGYRFTPSGDLEPIPGGPASPGLTPKDIQKREAAFPQATQSVKGFQTKSEQFIAELERLRDDPGLDQITGPIYGRTPSVSRAGSRAQALYDKIFAKGGFQALQDMREASKTGGALGNVSNEEGRRLEKSIVGGLDRTQNIADVQQGINDLIAEIRVSQERVKEAYDTTYEYRAQRGAGGAGQPPAPAAAGGNTVTLPDGRVLTFPNAKAAADFKKAARLP